MERRTLLGAAAAAALARPALAQATSRTLRFVPQANLSSPDPIWTTADVTRNHAYLIYDTLYGVDTGLTPSPQMCAGHVLSDDKLTWRFTLRDGLLFHDGTKVSGADCVASIARWGKRDGFGQILAARLDGMRAIDDKTFELRTKKPFPPMLLALGANSCFIMPERVAQTDAFKQIDDFTGSGPFRFVREEWVSGSRSTYARFDKYLPGAGPPSFSAGAKIVNVDRVEWQVMPDAATAAAALQNNEVDWVEQPLIDLMPMLQRSRDVVVQKFDPFGVVGVVVFNHLHPPFDNPKLRRALLPALDQGAYLSAVIGDQPEFKRAGVGVFAPGTPLANDTSLASLTGPRDVARAKQLVAEFWLQGRARGAAVPDRLPDLAGGRDHDPRAVRQCRPQRGVRHHRLGHADCPPRQPGAGGERRVEHVLHLGAGLPARQPDLQQHDPRRRPHRLVRLARQPRFARAARRLARRAGPRRGTEDRRRHPAHRVRGGALHPDRAVVHAERLAQDRVGHRQRVVAGVLEPEEGVRTA